MVNRQTRVLSWRAAIKRVTWQLSSKLLCSLSVRVTWQSSNAILGPVEICKLSFRFYVITYRLFTLLAKTDAENCNTYLRLQMDSGRFSFRFLWSMGQASGQESYLPVSWLCKERGQKLEYYYSCELWPCVGGTLSHNLNTNLVCLL